MKIKIWGARGSIPTPISSHDLHEKMIAVLESAKGIDLDDPIAVRNHLDTLHPLIAGTAGGDTSCVEVQVDDKTIILDAGTGIRALGEELMAGPCGRGEGVIYLFFSHTHWDHIQGLPFFLPAYVPGNQINIYGIHPVKTSLTSQMQPATFPITLNDLQADLNFVSLSEGQALDLDNIHITNMRLYHPGNAYAFRFEHQGRAFVYATDVECKSIDDESLQPFINFFANAEALVFDSQFTLRESLVKADWGHSSALIGAEIARQARVKRLILFHHDPTTSDTDLLKILEETQTYQAQFEAEPSTEILVGRASLALDLHPPETFTIALDQPTDIAVVAISEAFDQNDVAQVLTRLTADRSAAPLPKLIVDLSPVRQLDIAGLRSLIDLRNEWTGQAMALAGLSTQAHEIIELTNCLDLFAIYPTVKAAQDALELQETFRLPGQLIRGRYQIEGKLRENEIGTVFKATDTRLDRPVALLILSPTFSQPTTRRLLQQAQKSAQLQTSGIITLFDTDEDRGLVFLVMEHVEAQTLRALLDAGITPPLLEVAANVTETLEYAHSNGVIHGNLRPGNILIGDEVKLADFGLRFLEDNRPLADAPILAGTARYLAPEQIDGQPIDARTDLYALGVILYQLSTGQAPFTEENQLDSEKRQIEFITPPRRLNPKLSRSFEHLILKLLAKNPAARYETATQVHQVLGNLDKDSAAIPSDQPSSKVEYPIAKPPVPELIPQHRGRLVGRDQELEQLRQLWSLAAEGKGQIGLIGGEAGIGKTRLAEEIQSGLHHGVALIGRCSDFEGNPPYQPFVEIGRSYLAQTPVEVLQAQLTDSASASNFAAVLAPLLTDLYDILPNLTPLPHLDPEQEEARIKSSVVQFIQRVAVDRPWLIVLDDLHWSDPSSLQLLHYLARHAEQLPLLIVGTYRDVELDTDHPLRELMGTLSRMPIYHQITLQRLNQAHTGQLLADMWQQEIPPDWLMAIHERAGGNPFYIKEVAKALVDEGHIVLKDGVWHFAKVVELKLPPKIHDIVLRRINRVSRQTQEILRLAAVLGQQFNFVDLLAIAKHSEDDLLVGLDEAMAHNLIREVDAAVALAFSNIEIQQVIYENLSKLRRSRLHRQVGQALVKFYQADLIPVAGRLAYHFIQANDTQMAFSYSLKAGQHAQSLYAYQTALRWYTQAAALLPERIDYTADHVALYQGLGDMLQTQTRFSEATRAYQTMSQAAEAIGDTRAQVHALYALSGAQNAQGDHHTALATAKQAEVAARMAKAQTILARSLYEQGWALLNLGQTDQALAVGEQVLTFSSTIDATYEIGQSLNLLAAVYNALGNYRQAGDYQQQALSLYRQLGDRNRVSLTLNRLGESYYLQDDYQSAAALFQEALEIAREIGDRASEILYLSSLAGSQVKLQNYAAAEADLLQVIQMPETIRSAALSGSYRYLAEARLGTKKVSQALAEAQLALALAKEANASETIGLAWRTLGRVIAQQPNPITLDDRVYTPAGCFAESLRTFTDLNRPGQQARTLRAWASFEERKNNPTKAQNLRQEAKALLAD